MGFPIWSRDISPITGKWRCVTVEVNGTVAIAGIPVRPGDLVIADETGTCFVPQRLIETVLPLAEAITMKEREVMREIDGGIPIPPCRASSSVVERTREEVLSRVLQREKTRKLERRLRAAAICRLKMAPKRRAMCRRLAKFGAPRRHRGIGPTVGYHGGNVPFVSAMAIGVLNFFTAQAIPAPAGAPSRPRQQWQTHTRLRIGHGPTQLP